MIVSKIITISEQLALPRMRTRPRGQSRHCSENHPTSLQTHVIH